jgi:hypothetical protein
MWRSISGWHMKLGESRVSMARFSAMRSLRAGAGRRAANLVIRSSMLRGSRMKVGRVTRLRSAPGRSWEMRCERTMAMVRGRARAHTGEEKLTIALIRLHDLGVIVGVGPAIVGRGSVAFLGGVPPVRQHASVIIM